MLREGLRGSSFTPVAAAGGFFPGPGALLHAPRSRVGLQGLRPWHTKSAVARPRNGAADAVLQAGRETRPFTMMWKRWTEMGRKRVQIGAKQRRNGVRMGRNRARTGSCPVLTHAGCNTRLEYGLRRGLGPEGAVSAALRRGGFRSEIDANYLRRTICNDLDKFTWSPFGPPMWVSTGFQGSWRHFGGALPRCGARAAVACGSGQRAGGCRIVGGC